MTDYAALKAEIIKPAYNGMTDVQIAAAVNLLNVTLSRDISHRAARDALLFTTAGDWGNLVGVAEGVITSGITVPERVRAVSIRECFRGNMNDMFAATNEANWTKLLAAWDAITPEIVSVEGKNAIIALGRYTIKFAASIGWPGGVGDGDVAAARNWT